MASATLLSRLHRTGSIQRGLMAFAWPQALSPICHATISIIIRIWTRTLPRKCGCSIQQPGQAAVINADSDVADKVVAACEARGLRLFTVGRTGEAIKLLEMQPEDFATALTLEHNGKTFSVRLPLAGDFQVQNALVAAGLILATGGLADQVFAALEKLEGASGRLELVGRRNDAPIFVDYAHKPDALDKVLRTLRPLARNKLIVVFGCGGDRDKGKRPIMGELAARLADEVIVTDDNPRSENPNHIRAEILAGARGVSGAKIEEIGDRARAIAAGVAALREGRRAARRRKRP